MAAMRSTRAMRRRSASPSVRLKPDTTEARGTSNVAGVPSVRPERSTTNSASAASPDATGTNDERIADWNVTAVSSASDPPGRSGSHQ